MQRKTWWKWTVAVAIVGLAATCTMDASALQMNRIKREMKMRAHDYVVASPRAALARPMIPAATVDSVAPTAPPITAAAHNFARPHGSVLLPYGHGLNVRLSPEAEGVWYPRSSGWLGTFLIVDASPFVNSMVTSATVPDATWIAVGRDGAADRRIGPSIGTAKNIGVRFNPSRPGEYLLRARVFTYAMPVEPTVAPPTTEAVLATNVATVRGATPERPPSDVRPMPEHPPTRPPAGSFIDFDTVFIKVRVLARNTPANPPEIRNEENAADMPRELFSDVRF